MRLELQVKFSGLAGVLFLSRMDPVVMELLLIGGNEKKMVSRREQSSNTMLQQKWVWEKWIQKENACHME